MGLISHFHARGRLRRPKVFRVAGHRGLISHFHARGRLRRPKVLRVAGHMGLFISFSRKWPPTPTQLCSLALLVEGHTRAYSVPTPGRRCHRLKPSPEPAASTCLSNVAARGLRAPHLPLYIHRSLDLGKGLHSPVLLEAAWPAAKPQAGAHTGSCPHLSLLQAPA